MESIISVHLSPENEFKLIYHKEEHMHSKTSVGTLISSRWNQFTLFINNLKAQIYLNGFLELDVVASFQEDIPVRGLFFGKDETHPGILGYIDQLMLVKSSTPLARVF